MARILSDAELAARVRRRNREGGLRRRERLTQAGFVQINCWIPETTRAEVERLMSDRNELIGDVVTLLLDAGLRSLDTLQPAPSQQRRFDTTLQISIPEPVTTAERDAQILELKRRGLSSREIAKQVSCGKTTVLGVLKRMEAHQ